jgi:hypothetical protein
LCLGCIQCGGMNDNAQSARLELLEWVRSKIPEYDIKVSCFEDATPLPMACTQNFFSDWQSGKAICALAEAVEPGQVNLASNFKNDPRADATMGMACAEKNMGIPMVLDPEDMVGDADELSNMTYISYFRDYANDEKRKEKRLERVRKLKVRD